MKRLITLILGIITLSSCNRPFIDIPEITQDELFKSISFLSSDSLKGRKSGTPEGKVAAQYIAGQLLHMGYKPLGEDAFQYFEVITEITAGENNTLSFDEESAVLNKDFTPYNFSANTEASGEIVFCGFGFDINEDGIQWNDYKDVDLTGKWALILRADPELDNPDSKFIPFSGETSKLLNAKDNGTIGVLFVSGKELYKKDELVELELDQSMSNFGIPAFHITRGFANKLLEGTDKTIELLELQIIESKKPLSFIINKAIFGSCELIHKKVNTQNVVVWLEGTDKKLKDEFIVFGAHYDHLGMGGPNSGSRTVTEIGIHHGADDNASGVASLIEIAEKLAANRASLKRSVLIMAFGAEEIGLLGSKFFTSNPLVELDKIKEMVNIDMVGRLKPSKDLLVGGSGTAVESEALLDSLVKPYGLVLSFSPNGFGPSDHAAFYAENKPVFFFSTGAHADYHTPRDIIDSINFTGLIKLSDFIYDLGYDLLTRETNLTYQEAGPKGRLKKSGRKSKVKLGIMPNFGKSDNNGLRVDAVTPQGPAYLGGMKKGDIITAIEGKEISNIYEYMERMSKLRFGQTVNIDVLRDDEKKILLIQLEEIN